MASGRCQIVSRSSQMVSGRCQIVRGRCQAGVRWCEEGVRWHQEVVYMVCLIVTVKKIPIMFCTIYLRSQDTNLPYRVIL